MTLAINMLKNTIPLHTKTQNYHCRYPSVLYNTCHDVKEKIHLKIFLVLIYSIILPISGRDTFETLKRLV